ncbi:MAG: hypothetical protein ACJAWZ_001841 [Paracoccaceae bacterium]
MNNFRVFLRWISAATATATATAAAAAAASGVCALNQA